jgi:hypothetical protein
MIDTITCPRCREDIRLTESVVASLLQSAREEYEKRLADQEAAIAKREASIIRQERALAEAQGSFDERVAAKVQEERASIAADEAKKASARLKGDLDAKDRQLAELEELLTDRDSRLTEAQDAQAEAMRKQRELEDAKRGLDLTIEKRVQASLADIRENAKQEAEDAFKRQVAERELTIERMKTQIDDLRRKADQGSQELQGEVQEQELEAVLRAKFLRDTFEPVPRGERGADVLQRVFGPMERPCGTILWESKRTKNWSAAWLDKLREDKGAAKADLVVLVSQALPRDVNTLGYRDGLWITCPRTVVPVAVLLRHSLIEMTMLRQADMGRQTKMEMVYDYLTGPRFRDRVRSIVDAFSAMQADLNREKRTITRQWAKREKQIERMMEDTAGMYGELQGIAGETLPEIDDLELDALPAPDESIEQAT